MQSNSCVIQQSLVAVAFFFFGCRWRLGHGDGRAVGEIEREMCKEKVRERERVKRINFFGFRKDRKSTV